MSEETVVTPGDDDGAGGKMPLLDHLIELRSRLLKSLLAIAVAFGVCLYFAEDIFRVLVQPLVAAGQGRIIYTQLFEAFFVQIKVALFAAMMIAFPVIANQLWKFVAPGLYRQEKRALLPFLFATPVLFAAGASLAYFVTVPVALRFLLGFQGDLGGIQQEALPSVANYLSFIMQFIMAFGICFLLPILLMLLERAGIVTREQLVSARRYMVVAAFAIAAVATPPDILSQFLLAVPLILLYEISIFAIWFTQRRRKTGAQEAPVEPLEEA
ncbi:twin-arginine translocase subunit TatC [Sphingopyxis sp. RIFCSPHIGHO2_12_FULL_65_19]|uniref:twin-arginine translocase subunit TatC n=1 Tax=Sphingopyxis sp. RIFCSPHIGHO2_12_FULL_65_19 TaxID=1802172 RepID=UPI0008AF28FF|nr:twin-arginine translocase subunit TatC [Sphingopyxis sp. RIFCSPHIGHO2_12_FULL_65_19]OHD05868.1 MAG: twin arginine-targeting protein translocase TatC [Sphingopyxis sp. RIFCSPHIGHO2_12_FULL_65_19]